MQFEIFRKARCDDAAGRTRPNDAVIELLASHGDLPLFPAAPDQSDAMRCLGLSGIGRSSLLAGPCVSLE